MFKILIACLLGVVLGACSAPNRAPVQERNAIPKGWIGYHVVGRGETLYSIAWRYDINPEDLAKRNGIRLNDTIYAGQRLSLYRNVAPATTTRTASNANTSQNTSSPKTSAQASRSKTATSRSPSTTKKVVSRDGIHWRWPADGKLLTKYSGAGSASKGIDIEGRLGDSVLAAAAGVVVYAGNGIRGYGNLLIIKHNDTFLSAYAHNSKLLVKEQVAVKVGQKIAEIGNSGTDREKLHFEIRREGKPVDPMTYLPKR